MERSKTIFLILVCITAFAVILSVSMNTKVQSEVGKRKSLDSKIAELEKQTQMLTQSKSAFEENLKDSIGKLEDEKRLSESLKSALAQEQLISQSLRAELDKINKAKKVLEERLKK